jgi:hypothetical protein
MCVRLAMIALLLRKFGKPDTSVQVCRVETGPAVRPLAQFISLRNKAGNFQLREFSKCVIAIGSIG